MKKCTFCDLSQIGDKIFAETTNFRAIYNLYPILPGHVLIIPKKHKVLLKDLSDKEVCEMMQFTKKVSNVIEDVFKAEGLDFLIQDGVVAGQIIPHLHLHIIPRKSTDILQGKIWRKELANHNKKLENTDFRNRARLSKEEIAEIVVRLKRYFG